MGHFRKKMCSAEHALEQTIFIMNTKRVFAPLTAATIYTFLWIVTSNFRSDRNQLQLSLQNLDQANNDNF